MKKFKVICFIFAIILAFSSVFCVGVSAVEEKEGYIINTDVIYARIPDDYHLSYGDTYFSFYNDYCNSLYVAVYENILAQDFGIMNLPEDKVKDIFIKLFIYEENTLDDIEHLYNFEKVTIEKTKVNGISVLKLTGAYTDYSLGEDFDFPFCAYILATKENIFLITYEECDKDEADTEDISQVMETLLVNGTYFNGDKLASDHNFENAPTYEKALEEAEKNLALEDYDDLLNSEKELFEDILGSDMDEEVMRATIRISKVLLFLFIILPFIFVLIIAIINIISYIRNKKKLNSLEAKFGYFENLNYYPPQNENIPVMTPGATTENGYIPYVQNPFEQNTGNLNVQNGVSPTIPEMNNGDSSSSGFYPTTENQFPEQNGNEQI